MLEKNVNEHGVHDVSIEAYNKDPKSFKTDFDMVTQKLQEYIDLKPVEQIKLDHVMRNLPYDRIMKYLIQNQEKVTEYNQFISLFNKYYKEKYPQSFDIPIQTANKEVKKVKKDVEITKSLFDSQRDYALAILSKNNKKVEDLQKELNVVLPKGATHGTFGPITLKALVEYQKLHQKELNISDKEFGFFGPKTYAILFPSVQASAPTPIITPKAITEQMPEVVNKSSSSASSESSSSVRYSSSSSSSAMSHVSSTKSSLVSSSSSSSSVRSAVGSSSSNSSQEIKLDEVYKNDQDHVNKIIKQFNSHRIEKTSNGIEYKKITFKELNSNITDYIYIPQDDDGDIYLWDNPQNDQRTVYRLDRSGNILGKATVKKDGTIVENKNQLNGLKYDPINNQ